MQIINTIKRKQWEPLQEQEGGRGSQEPAEALASLPLVSDNTFHKHIKISC